jgi:NRAMP (natural resistance-associated macrophage protein)-like metal ion transporter
MQDPGNLEADIRVGITARYSLLWWFAICVLCFGFAFQALSGKVGLVTGRDLAYNIGLKYPAFARILLYALLEASLIAADIQETVGCALALQILSSGTIPLWAGCIVVSVAAFLMLQLDRFSFRSANRDWPP